MVRALRTQVITLRVSPVELEMLKELADADGIYQSDVVRLLVRHAHAERFGEQKPTTKKAPKRRG